MRNKIATTALWLTLASAVGPATAQDVTEFMINGEIPITVVTEAPEHVENLRQIYSGWYFRSPETQAMQMDDFDNPGMLAVENAIVAWNTVEGEAGESCASCHGAPEDLAGVRAVYPKWHEGAGEVRTMSMQINACRTERMGAEGWGYDDRNMTAMEALLASVSRGYEVAVAIDGPVREAWELGKELYYTRFGQLELSCANCHEDNYDNLIRADHLSQGMVNGFPTYRLRNSGLVSVHNRFRGCIRDTRGETFSVGSEEFIALELYVASRGNGLSIEGPSVRN